MQVPGDLVRDAAGTRLVPQRQAFDLDVADDAAAETFADLGIVVAGDPDPLAVLLHDVQDLQLLEADASRRLDIVQAVAEGDDGAGAVAVDGGGQALQRLARVVGREELSALGEGGALLEMQIGDDQRVLARPIERARHVGTKQLAANRDLLVLEVVEGEALRFQLEHSISSRDGRDLDCAAASRSSSSRAKPATASLPISSRIGTESGDTLSNG